MTQHAHTLETTGLDPLPLPPETPHLGPIAYYKRFRMEADLADTAIPELPQGFTCVPWSPPLIDAHAEALFGSFEGEIDAGVFASLGDREGCRGLMRSIVARPEFVPQATWLLVANDGVCGTVQGLRERRGIGAIQNLGLLPDYRGQGLGPLLLFFALNGFRQAGLSRAGLEVTAKNERALKLYARLGFRRVKTLYKAVPVAGFSFVRAPLTGIDYQDC